jgi:hypothetical protein
MIEVSPSQDGGSIRTGESSGITVKIKSWTQEEAEHYLTTGVTPLERLHRENLAAMWA